MDKVSDNVDNLGRKMGVHPALMTNKTEIKNKKAVNKPLPQSKYARVRSSSERNTYIPRNTLAENNTPFKNGNNSKYTDGSISVGEPSWFNRRETVVKLGIYKLTNTSKRIEANNPPKSKYLA